MNHDWSTRSAVGLLLCRLVLRRAVFEIEALGELEVELNRRALEGPFERVLNGDVDFRTIECAVAGVELPPARIVLLEDISELLGTESADERDRMGLCGPFRRYPMWRARPRSCPDGWKALT
jgi:hypothetical protein